ncbi:Na+-exporting ATPase [Fusarium oxysporum f. sp. conglutinans race 2 54008]|uniref:Na+-exporting ATPase n=1 Tax=Fusarium oxysporum f. sp. conglutinans race 2 54008 TaxID=1089457 RepID=X0H3K7_FUSOX|nr:Na+-exporting ATPase [Fusarium oxysporum f. sp. conglutinans race 2 54008]
MALLAVITNQDDGGKRCAGLDVPRGYGMKRRISIPQDSLQEFQAAKTTDSLRSLSSPTADAVRGGNNETVVTVEIVPGDMVELNIGDTIPVDIRLVEAVNFEANEALLASEPLPVRKDVAAIF